MRFGDDPNRPDGRDRIDAAAGRDRVSAGSGRDAILARDGARDAIACGPGSDIAVADELDALAGAPFSTCRAAPASRRVRVLKVRTTGALRLAARYAASARRKATWTVEERCGGTLTRVRRGRVSVTDRGRRRAVVVSAPRAYLSKPTSSGGR